VQATETRASSVAEDCKAVPAQDVYDNLAAVFVFINCRNNLMELNLLGPSYSQSMPFKVRRGFRTVSVLLGVQMMSAGTLEHSAPSPKEMPSTSA